MILSRRTWEEIAVALLATETTHKIIQIDFRQKIIKCFYSEQKANKTKMCLAFDSINNPGDAVLNLVTAVINRFILRKVTQKY